MIDQECRGLVAKRNSLERQSHELGIKFMRLSFLTQQAGKLVLS